MTERPTMLITGASRGIGRHLVDHYLALGWQVVGCSRGPVETASDTYRHYCLDVADEPAVKRMFGRFAVGSSWTLINNAGIASMNHVLTTPSDRHRIMETNVVGVFLFCRGAAKLMQRRRFGRIVNFATVATPLKLEGEAIYASSKAAVITLTQILARELADFGITVNAVGPAPVRTDLVAGVPAATMDRLIGRQAIRRFGELRDIDNVIDFFLRPESDFVTGQTIFLGGV
jgi:3-oxoacyl-[acyl-carrier protein] reductase